MQFVSTPFSAAFREKYDIIENIGTGAFGAVYLARQLSLGREVAIKHLAPKHIPNENLLKRFLREAKVLSTLSHPNIVEIYDYGLDGELPYLVQELLSGRALDEYLCDEGPLTEESAISIASQVASALQCAHENGVIHRDLKPANIFIGEDDRVKVLDFGLAMTSPEVDERLTKTGLVIGTPGYMAPELFYGKRATPCTDLYALGLMLFEMVAGERPGEDENGRVVAQKRLTESAPLLSSVLNKPVSRKFEKLVASLLELEPEERPQSAKVLLSRFSKINSADDSSMTQRTGLNVPLNGPLTTPLKGPIPGLTKGNKLVSWAAFLVPLVVVLLIGLAISHLMAPTDLLISNVTVETSTDEVVLGWQSEEKTESSVEYGKRQSELLKLTSAEKPSKSHRVTIKGLQPATRYVWRPSVDGYLPGNLREFRTKRPLAIKGCKVSRKGATEVEVVLSATAEGQLSVLLENLGESQIDGRGPEWTFTLRGLKASSNHRATVKIRGDSKVVSRKLSFQTIAAHTFITLAELRPDKKGSSSPIISPLFMENVRVYAPCKLFQNSIIMAVEKYGLHSYSLAERKSNWHKRELSKIFLLRLFGDRFFALGTDGILRCFRADSGELLWTTRGIETNLLANAYLTKGGVFLWLKSGPARFSSEDGIKSWQLHAEEFTHHWMVTDSLLWIVDKKHCLRAYEANTGRRRTELDRELEANVASAIVEGEGHLLFGLDDSTAMIVRPGEEPLRVGGLSSSFTHFVGHAPGKMICAFRDPPMLAAFALKDGRKLWSRPIGSPVKTAFARRGPNVYYGDDRDFLVAINSKTGEKLWERYGNIVARFRLHPTPRGVLFCSSSLALNEVIDGLEP